MEKDVVKVSDVMTKDVVVLGANDSLERATQLFDQHQYDGFPVLNEDGGLLGLVTAYDMVSQSYATHLPSLIHILESISDDKFDKNALKEHFNRVKEIKVRDMMNTDPLVIGPDERVENLAKEFLEHHRVNPIPVVDANKKLVGIVSRFDIIKFFDEKYLDKMLTDSGHGGVLQRLGRLE